MKDLPVLTCDDGVAVVVESATEDLVAVTFKHLLALSSLRVPQSSRLVNTGRQHLGALRVETDLQTDHHPTYILHNSSNHSINKFPCSALTLLVRRQEGHLACKVGCWFVDGDDVTGALHVL